MEMKCEYCGAMIPDTAASCPQCGGTNNNMKRAVDNTPKTIEELKQWYAARNLPPYETTRFFIGINYKNPRAFGIYEENGKFIVYKNKDNGQRAIRYEGTDEAYAVNELYLKLKSEILNQKEINQRNSSVRPADKYAKRKSKGSTPYTIGLIALFILLIMAVSVKPVLGLVAAFGPLVILVILNVFLGKNTDKSKNIWSVLFKILPFFSAALLIAVAIYGWNGASAKYYRVGNDLYCKYDYAYYLYQNGDYYSVESWELPYELSSDSDSYRVDDDAVTYDQEFENSWYYSENFASDSSSDSDYDWGSDSSWDSGSTDWGSDW